MTGNVQPSLDANEHIPIGGGVGGKRSVLVGFDGSTYRVVKTDSAGALVDVVSGDVAHDSVDSGNPVKIGGTARTTNPTAVADADRVNASFDKLGRQIIVAGNARGLSSQNTITLTNTTETTLLSAGASGVFHDLTTIMVANTSATAVRVDFRDATAGTVRFSMYAPAGATIGAVFDASPWEQTSSANNWTAQLSASVTDVRIAAKAIKNL